MYADIHTMYESDFCRILDFKCRCNDCKTSKPEYSTSFGISFVRKGNFLFNVFRHSLDSYNGCILITKPGYERTVTHIHVVPDECTIFDFKNKFYESELLADYGNTKFFRDNDLHSTLIRTNTETEFLHFSILQLLKQGSPNGLQIDSLIMEVVDKVLCSVTDYSTNAKINERLKKNHLITIERAKEYINENFAEDITLAKIAGYCCVSPFHFSRVFKTFTSFSPSHFLQSIRLKNAEVLIRNTTMPVTDVAFASGFNSIEYFTAAFHQKYNCPPSKFRSRNKRYV